MADFFKNNGDTYPSLDHNGVTVSGRDQSFEPVGGGVQTDMSRLFSNRNQTFWVFQAIGWTGYILVRLFQAITMGMDVASQSKLYVLAAIIGIIMTVGMRYIYRIVRRLPLPIILVTVIVLCAGLGLLFSSIELSLAAIIVPGQPQRVGLARFGNAMFEATALFAWSAIYFGYHYYTAFQEQQEQALKANAMAHQAQLKMLRYQLNPHFLFNTLNAISTLVLEKAGDDANKMLTKLSNFLRYTLVNQPSQRVSIEQELYALGLYLDIEEVRFGDRLRTDFDIDERARDMLIPSLILQPLIENAIKYAIAPSIDGGTLTIRATVKDRRLTLFLGDSGPGIPDIKNIVRSQSGSGVGIANTKDRLQQIYGDDHSFRLENLDPTGLGITIEIPAQKEEDR